MQTVTLRIPEELYSRIQQRAQRSRRSLEAEFIDVLSLAVQGTDDLPPELAQAFADLDGFDDERLWQAARSRLPPEISTELESLHLKQQRRGLSDEEGETMERLSLEYDRFMLVRARAAMLLKERGHDVAEVVGGP
jgi:plasmid stability protein